MAIKLQNISFLSSSSSNPWVSQKPIRTSLSYKDVADFDHLLSNWGNSRKRCPMRFASLGNGTYALNRRLMGFKKQCLPFRNSRRIGHLVSLVSADDGLTVDGSPQASTSTNVEKKWVKHNLSMLDEDYSDGLVQTLHDAAMVFELSIKEPNSSKISWFPTSWFGKDKNAWMKTLSYQASVYSLLQAASEISVRGDCRYRDVNVFVHKSLSRISTALESVIWDKLSANQPEAYEWFWSKQIPAVITSYVNCFEGDLHLTASTTVLGKGNPSDISLLMIALTCFASITKLGPAKVSCFEFFSLIPDITGGLMDMLVDCLPIDQAHHSIKSIGLHREFLVHFGSRAAACGLKNDQAAEEAVFWVNIVQYQLQQAIDRERLCASLATSESIEVLERDLAVFGFFIALGRSTQSFLSANGFDGLGDPMESFIRYLIGASVLYYPRLSSISFYQLYVEVVCEELDWIPFYPGDSTRKQSHIHRSKHEGPPNAEAIAQVLDVCSYWMQTFMKYSKWLENPSNVKAERFLSRGHNKLMDCIEEQGILKNELIELEKRVQRSTEQPDNEEDIEPPANTSISMVQVQKKKNLIEKFIYKLKQVSTDVWQGTQLLAMDIAAAMRLLHRVLCGDKLTEKEKKSFHRTLIDLASVVPISILMLLPVTAVGHAAILAAIKKYVPALIPSTYGSERLNLFRQLEKMKEIEKSDVNPSENLGESA